jgi:hypothetical protein
VVAITASVAQVPYPGPWLRRSRVPLLQLPADGGAPFGSDAAQATLRKSTTPAHADGVREGWAAGAEVGVVTPSSTAWSGSSQLWHTIQIGPGSLTRRSRRWRSPHSSQVMVTRIALGSVAWRLRRLADGTVAGAPSGCNELAKEDRSAPGDTLGEIVMALAQTRHSPPRYDRSAGLSRPLAGETECSEGRSESKGAH